MKVLFYSSTFYADCDFPLIKRYQQSGVDITYLIYLSPIMLKSNLFNIRHQLPYDGIVSASDYLELDIYKGYFDLNKVYIANRYSKSGLSLGSFKLMLKVAHFILKKKFDIIHFDHILALQETWIYSLCKKIALTVHDPFPHTGESSIKKNLCLKLALQFADGIVLLNSKQKENFVSHYKVSESKVLVNRLGVYENIVSFADKDIVTKKHNVLFFGRISPYKGIEYLCEAMAIVKNRIPDVSLTIAGGGNLYFDIQKISQDWIELHNHFVDIRGIANLVKTCEIVVCPYIDATQSGVVMTAYAMSKPVIATNVGGLPEMVEDNVTGLIVESRNATSLADAIFNLFTSETVLDKMKRNIKNKYNNGIYSWESIAALNINFYESLLMSK